MTDTIVCASGYMNPIDNDRIEYLKMSRDLGSKLIVIVNNDKQSLLKNGSSFMPEEERLKIVRNLECVDCAILSIDNDLTVCKTLKQIHPDIFTTSCGCDVPENAVCKDIGVKIVNII